MLNILFILILYLSKEINTTQIANLVTLVVTIDPATLIQIVNGQLEYSKDTGDLGALQNAQALIEAFDDLHYHGAYQRCVQEGVQKALMG